MSFKSTRSNVLGKYLEVYETDVLGQSVGVGDAAPPSDDVVDDSQVYYPPYSAVATLNTTVSNSDGKLGISSDNVSFGSSITVDVGDKIFVDWGTDVLSAAQGSRYTTSVDVDYNEINVQQQFNIVVASIDRIPNQFTFTDQTDVLSDSTVVSAPISMIGSINAPAYIWGSSDSSNAQISIGNTAFFAIPAAPTNAVVVSSKDEIRVRHVTTSGSETVTNTTINIGISSASASDYKTDTFSTTNQSIGIVQPVISYPSASSTGHPIWQMYVNTTGYAKVGEPGTLASTRWQIATDSGFSSLVVDQTVNSSATDWDAPYFALNENTQYYVRVTFTSSLGYTATSAGVTFTTGARLFTYLDASTRTSYTLPSSVTEYHTIMYMNFAQGENGVGGTQGSGTSPGSPGRGGNQGTLRCRSQRVGSATNITLVQSGATVTPTSSGGSGNNSGPSGSVSGLTAYSPGSDKDGNPVTFSTLFTDAMNISGGGGGSAGGTSGGYGGGGGGGGAGGVTFSYKTNDGTWSQEGGVPTFSGIKGATGGNNDTLDNGNRYGYGGTGGTGYGAGAGGGAGGAEHDGSLGSPGGGGNPGARAGALVLIL